MKILRPLLFILAGGLVGLLYYHFWGCTTGCPISSNPWLTMAYTGLVGWLLSGIFQKNPKKA